MINKLNLINFIEGKRFHLKPITNFSKEKYFIKKQNFLFFKKTPTVNKPKRILYSKGSIKIKNYVYQTPPLALINSIGWIATHFTNHYKRKFYTLIISSHGLFHWRPRIEKKNLSKLIFLCSPKFKPLNKFALFTSPAFDITGNQKVCLVSYSYKRTVYIKSPGSFAFFRSISWKSWSIIVVLPSQIKKLFTLFVYLTPGRIWGKNLKKFMNPKAGFWQKSGFKSIVRGVAKNPVDHHHGGKTTAIAKPVSPWGWIARKK